MGDTPDLRGLDIHLTDEPDMRISHHPSETAGSAPQCPACNNSLVIPRGRGDRTSHCPRLHRWGVRFRCAECRYSLWRQVRAMEETVDIPADISELIASFIRCEICKGEKRFTRFTNGRNLQLANIQVEEITDKYHDNRRRSGNCKGPYGLRVSGAGPLDGEYILKSSCGGGDYVTYRREYRANNTYDNATITFIHTDDSETGVRWGMKDPKGRLCYVIKQCGRANPD